MTEPVATRQVRRWQADDCQQVDDRLVVEEPCEIRLGGESVAVVMRTPGHDRELAAGFLYSEGIVDRGDIGTISTCADPDVLNPENIVEVRLIAGREPRGSWQRNFYATSSCGICGKASIEAVRVAVTPLTGTATVPRATVVSALRLLRQSQPVFDLTGGLHAAGLFDRDGNVIVVREDIGRHNAVDKVIGYAYLRELLPLTEHLLVVSGRSSFEIVQKALVAAIPVIAAVSAASSLAVELAAENNLALVGFARDERLVVYTGDERLV